mgnify:CR=1 FL=1
MQEPDELLDVAPFGEAHVADRVVHALLLVRDVVAPRSVGARDGERELLLVVGAPIDVHLGDADHADRRPVAGYGRGKIHRSVRIGCRRDDDLVDSSALRLPHRQLRRVVVQRADEGLEPRSLHGFIGDVVADHVASVSVEDTGADMPDKPHADDRDRFAGLHVRLMDALQRYPAERAERRLARIGEPSGSFATRFLLTRFARRGTPCPAIATRSPRKHVRDALAARHHATYGGVPPWASARRAC